jgi:O-antigen ligase
LGAENAGIVFLMGLFLSLWLWKLNKSRPRPPEPRYLKVRRSTWCVGSIALGLAMTLSRGPALGGFVGYLIARVGMVKRWRLALALAIVVIGAGFYVAHRRAAALEAAAESPVVDETVASATYRTRLYDVYEPVAVAGGLFGWSGTLYSKVARELNPKAANFFSIDNEYLLLWVAQGKVGLGLFLLIVGEGLYALIRAIVRSKDPLDTCLFYCLGGMLIGLSVVLITVFLAGQGYILFFLISGWIQSIPDGKWTPKSSPTFAFRRVFT